MGSCTSHVHKKERRVLIQTNDKVLNQNCINNAEGCRLKLSNQQSKEEFPKIFKINIEESELYKRRMIQKMNKTQMKP